MIYPIRCFDGDDLAAYRGSSRDDARWPQRTAWLQRGQVTDELTRTVFPGTLDRKITTRFTRHAERLQTGPAQIFIQRADRMIGDHVQRTGDRERRNRRAACQRFQLNDAKGVGLAWEHED